MIEFLQGIFNITWLANQLTTNDFLVAGMFGIFTFMLRDIPLRIWRLFIRNISIEFRITNEDYDYDDLVTFLEDKRIGMFSRTYSKQRFKKVDENTFQTKQNENDRKDLSLGYGNSWFFYNFTLGKITRSFKENNHSNSLKEEIFIQMFTRNRNILSKLLSESILEKNTKDIIKVYTPSRDYWAETLKINKRNFDSVFVGEKIKEDITTQIDEFLKNREWYIKRGIPYKLGIFIEGEPGTGKSSLVRAIASYLNRNIFFFNQQALKNSGELLQDFGNHTNSILVLEDIDTYNVVSEREGNEINEHDLSVLLNTLDGPLTPTNFIFIATTNYPEKIDKAFRRKGRFDIHAKIERLNFKEFLDMMHALYDIDHDIIKGDFEKDYKPLTGATVQNHFLQDKNYETSKMNILKEFQ